MAKVTPGVGVTEPPISSASPGYSSTCLGQAPGRRLQGQVGCLISLLPPAPEGKE